jgi:hypothetical protein
MMCFILMHTVSLTLCKAMDITIRNQHPDIELASPVCFCNRGTYCKYPFERTDDGAVKIGLRLDIDQDKSGGMLMYEVQRKGNIRFNYRSSIDTVYTKAMKEALKMKRLLITWEIKHSDKPKVNAILVEYNNDLFQNGDKLARLYEKTNGISFGRERYEYIWSMYSNTALKTRYETIWRTSLELEITICKGFRNQINTRQMWIDSERQVLSEVIICFY